MSWFKARDNKEVIGYRLLKPEEHEDIFRRLDRLEERLDSFAKCMGVKFDLVLGPDPAAKMTWCWDAKCMIDEEDRKKEGPKF